MGCHFLLQGIFLTRGSNPCLLCLLHWQVDSLNTAPPAAAAAAKSLQLCPTLCDPKEGSPPGSPVPGILQARTLEGIAIAFSTAPHGNPQIRVDMDIDVLVEQTCHTKVCLLGLKITFLFVRNKTFRISF